MEQHRHHDVGARLERLAYAQKPGTLEPALHELSEELLSTGYPRERLYEGLKHLVLDLRAKGREDMEDDVLEVMDTLSGWCAPSARL